jgi:chromosome partitioning protein
LPFKVVDERLAAKYAREFEHCVIDTEARPEEEDLRALADGCDLLVVPTTPDALALDALMLTVKALNGLGATRYRILLSIIPPRPSRYAEEARLTFSPEVSGGWSPSRKLHSRESPFMPSMIRSWPG